MPRRARWSRRLAHLLLLTCAAAVAATAAGTPTARAGPPEPPAYVAPVEAPVVDPFRPPAGPYGAGNRGLEYGTAPGTPVQAAADGSVTFAGTVAGTRHVTVLHADGLRTSYSFLEEVHVVVGQRVVQGHVVGTTTGHLHLGARRGDAYLDPASLFGPARPQVRLVPFDEPPGNGPSSERRALGQLIGGLGGALGLAGGALDEVAGMASWLRGGDQLLRTLSHYSMRFAPGPATVRSALTAYQAIARARAVADRPCSATDAISAPPPERRAAVLVAGLGSTSDDAAIDDVDTAALGYDAGDVVRFSYAGGRTPDPTDRLPLPSRAYAPADTQADLHLAAERLADLVEDVTEAVPGIEIDLYAHSQGGLVTRLALVELEHRHGAAWLERLGLVATLGTPHGGADLATGIHAVASTRAGSVGLDGAAAALGLELDDDGASVGQLSETSDVVAELRTSPIPDTVRAVSIAARGDLVVPVPRTVAPGATEVVVPVVGPHAHDALPGSPAAARELGLALAGLPPTCQPFAAALTDQVVGEGISWAEDTLGAAAWAVTARIGGPVGG